MWIEHRIEGTRSARMRRDRQSWTLSKLARKFAKHLVWGALALWTGFSFVGYFSPIHTLWTDVISWSLGPWESFWIVFYAIATYGNAGWMREQVCKYMCPYARFQSAMFDRDSLIITYDAERGEQRGPVGKASGDCIDCTLCVQVCPTGDRYPRRLAIHVYWLRRLRRCLQFGDEKIGRAPGLVRYATENAMKEKLSMAEIRRRIFRPRVVIYTLVMWLILIAFFGTLLFRIPLKLDVIRDRGVMGREVEDGIIENVYRLQIINTDEAAHRYRIRVSGVDGIALASPEVVEVAATETLALPVRVRVPPGIGHPGSNKIVFDLQSLDNERYKASEKPPFIFRAKPSGLALISRISIMPAHVLSSSRKPASTPWYRQCWPWLLMLGPAVVVVAGTYTGWLAFSRPDALVVDDYYKEGKAINLDLRRDREASRQGITVGLNYDAGSGSSTASCTASRRRRLEIQRCRERWSCSCCTRHCLKRISA